MSHLSNHEEAEAYRARMKASSRSDKLQNESRNTRYEPKPDTGAMFQNRKQHDRQPDWRGNCMVNGVVMEIAAWTKTTSKGTEMLSLKFSLPREREDAPAAPAKQANHRPLPDTDIPF